MFQAHLTGKRQKGKANLDFTEARDSEVGGVAQW